MKNKLFILIFIIGLGILAFYLFSSGPSSQLGEEKSPVQGKLEEKKQGIFDILPKGLQVGDLAPDFVSEDVYGNEISLSNFRNKKPVLLVFWATWCGYCAKELPGLKAFAQDHQNEIKVIAVDSGEPRETIRDYIQKENVNFLILLDKQRKIWNQYFVRGTPSHFLISSQGEIVSLRPGLASRSDLETMLTMLR